MDVIVIEYYISRKKYHTLASYYLLRKIKNNSGQLPEALQHVISRAKVQVCEVQLETQDRDPWSSPYLNVRGKLRLLVPPRSQSLRAKLLDSLVSVMFPFLPTVPPADSVPTMSSWLGLSISIIIGATQ